MLCLRRNENFSIYIASDLIWAGFFGMDGRKKQNGRRNGARIKFCAIKKVSTFLTKGCKTPSPTARPRFPEVLILYWILSPGLSTSPSDSFGLGEVASPAISIVN